MHALLEGIRDNVSSACCKSAISLTKCNRQTCMCACTWLTGHTQEIKIRARWASNKMSLVREESMLGTMLHELVHNVRGPHDK